MDIEYLLGSVLRGVMTGRGKRKKVKGAMRYVLGDRRAMGSGAMLLGGVALAFFEHLQRGGQASAAPPVTAGAHVPTPATASPRWAGAAPESSPVTPPPLPGAFTGPAPVPGTVSASPVVPPPLPVTPGPITPAHVPPEVLRVIRLSLSAAHADGVLTAAEQEAVLAQARQVGAESLIADDLRAPRPVDEILGGVTDQRQREHLYTIAFAIVRADERVTESERAYLQQVAEALPLDRTMVERLEADAVRQLDTQA